MPSSTTTNAAPDTAELAQFRERWKEEVRERKRQPQATLSSAESSKANASTTGTIAPDTTELAQFRQRWKEEVKGRTQQQQHPQQPSGTSTSTAAETSHSVGQAHVSTSATGQPLQTATAPSARLRTALEAYTAAVFEETRGNHPEATRLYRNAFRQDPNVDKAYHREELLRQQQQQPPRPQQLSKAFPHLSLTGPKERDLPPETERIDHSLEGVLKEWPASLGFEAENEAKGAPINKLPDEIIVYILFGFARSLDTGSIERFAAVCRRARIVSLDNSLWRRIIEMIMVPSQLPDPPVSVDEIAKRYRNDYRRMYIEYPHVRFDGVYIAICHYIRNGMGENPWVTVSHLITYRRFLRFFPNGKVLSYRANEDQDIGDVVHSLHQEFRKKDVCVGDWQLSGTTVVVSNLVDVMPSNDKYTFQMVLSLKSRPMGRWNKLDMLEYDSINMETGDVIPFTLKHDRPYWFSKVKSYRV